ncbi:hypothetical protein ONZ45_g10432 [Pleurotus djamor]|nr:hypothetical protein ONZ45_g10432 [Pleurotus djamor]
MTVSTTLFFSSLLLFPTTSFAAYSPTRDYNGASFFNHWSFFDKTDAGVTNGNAVIKVDNSSTVVWDNKRNSVRLESLEAYDIGSLIVIDVAHMPFGCSVWPAFWTRGVGGEWPGVGEIDIIEGVNRRTFNQMALHTSPGCTQASGASQSGTTLLTDCGADGGRPGCTVRENKPANYGPDFNAAGGGIFATQFDVSGVFIWFFSRPDIPEAIRTNASSIDTSTWGTPSASWPSSSCAISNFFAPQQLILDITLCGDFATPTYNATCGAPKKNCYEDNVLGNGTNYDDAYFEIPFIRVYSANPSASPSSLSAGSVPTFTSSAPGSSGTNSPASGGNSSDTPNNKATTGVSTEHVTLTLGLLVSAGFLFFGLL